MQIFGFLIFIFGFLGSDQDIFGYFVYYKQVIKLLRRKTCLKPAFLGIKRLLNIFP